MLVVVLVVEFIERYLVTWFGEKPGAMGGYCFYYSGPALIGSQSSGLSKLSYSCHRFIPFEVVFLDLAGSRL